MIETVLEGVAAGAATSASAGFLSAGANAAQLSDTTIKLLSYLYRQLRPSLRSDIESLGVDVALIYSKIARRCFILGIGSLFTAGFVTVDLPIDNGIEGLVDASAGGLALGGLGYGVIIHRRLVRHFRMRGIVSQVELVTVLAYERLVDTYLHESLSANRKQKLIARYLADGEADFFFAGRLVHGERDLALYVGRDPRIARDVRNTIARLDPTDRSQFVEHNRSICECPHALVRAIGHNNLAVMLMRDGSPREALVEIGHAEQLTPVGTTLYAIVRRNRQVILIDVAPSEGLDATASGDGPATIATRTPGEFTREQLDAKRRSGL